MNTPQTAEFQRSQFDFAAHIRDPDAHPAPAGVEDRRMAIYRELFYNNVESFLREGFPVLRELSDDAWWHALARDFFAHHRSRSPYFIEIPREFLDYLQNERGERSEDPPFLLELAHYEWVEWALIFSDAEREAPPADPNGDLMAGVPLLSPLAWNLSYRFPVHRIGPDYQPQEPGAEPTHLLVYRNRQDRVEFMEINVVTQRLIELLKEEPELTGLDAVRRIAQELAHPQPEVVMEAGRQLLQDLRHRDVLIGTRA